MPIEQVNKIHNMPIEHLIETDNKNSANVSASIEKVSNYPSELKKSNSADESRLNIGNYHLPSSIKLSRGYTHCTPKNPPLLNSPSAQNIQQTPSIPEHQGGDSINNLLHQPSYSEPENDFTDIHENSAPPSRKRNMQSAQSEIPGLLTSQSLDGATQPKIIRLNSSHEDLSPGPSSPFMPHFDLLSPNSASSPCENHNSPYLSDYYSSPESSEYSPYSDSEIFVNAWRDSIALSAGSHINTRGYIERNDFDTLYRVEKIDRVIRRGPPEQVGFRESNRFDGVPKMIDGQVLIVSRTKEGAECFGNAEYRKGNYHLYEIDAKDINAVSMEENVEKNERFVEEAKEFDPGFFQRLRSENRLDDFFPGYDEVHLAMNDLTPDRVKKLY